MSKRSDANDLDARLRKFEKDMQPQRDAERRAQEAKDARELERELSSMFSPSRKRRKGKR
jgi:hypothetical protein